MLQELQIPKTRKKALNILGLQGSADKKEVEKAYKKYALKWHPDKWSDKSKEEQNKATENFKAVNVAHKILIGEITEEFISQQTNDDWIDELVKNIYAYMDRLEKEYRSSLSNEETALFGALSEKDLEKTKSLLEKIKNINIRPICGERVSMGSHIATNVVLLYDKAPLHYIVQNACEEPNNGWKALLEEILPKYSSSNLTAAHASNAITCSKSNIIDVNIGADYIGTSLHIACRLARLDVINLLIDHEADPNVCNGVSKTPLYYALEDNRNDVAELLLARGASSDTGLRSGSDPKFRGSIRSRSRELEIIGIATVTCALALYFLTPLILGANVALGTKLALGAAGAVIGCGVGYLTNIVIDKLCSNEVTLDTHIRCST